MECVAKEVQFYFQIHRLTLTIAPNLEFLFYFCGRTRILEFCLSQKRIFFAYNFLEMSTYHWHIGSWQIKWDVATEKQKEKKCLSVAEDPSSQIEQREWLPCWITVRLWLGNWKDLLSEKAHLKIPLLSSAIRIPLGLEQVCRSAA